MSDRHDLELFDPEEIVGIDGEERQLVGDGHSRDQRIVGASSMFAARGPQGCGNPTEGSGCCAVERDCLEAAFGQLKMCLPYGTFRRVVSHQGANAQLGQRDGGY